MAQPQAERDAPTESPPRSRAHICRADLVFGIIVTLAVVAAFTVPHLHLRWPTPLVHQSADWYRVLAETAPILGAWMPHVNWATLCAVVVAIGVVAWGPSLAARARWSWVALGSWVTAGAWTMALSLIDGWIPGFISKLDGVGSYRRMVPAVGSIHGFLHTFTSHILDSQINPWNIDIAGHPPGALLTFVALNRVGLGGPGWASGLSVLVGTSAAPAVLIAVRSLSTEDMARRAAPFVAMAPAAVWIGVSADAFFAGVAAWGLALLALAATKVGRSATVLSVAAGLLLGISLYLNYGFVLLAIPALAVLIIADNYRPLVGAVLGVLIVAAIFTGEGFWWFEGLSLLRHRYLIGISMDRPYGYWVWANLVSLTCAIGFAAAVALRRAFSFETLRAKEGLQVLMVAFVIVVIAADLSGLSKAETERIWLAFSVWLVAAPALLPRASHRIALALQAVGALVINSLLLTTW